MATSPQAILNQTVPTASQPTAAQPPISQASSVLPVSQAPGVASAPSLGASSQGSFPQNRLLSTAAPGQPTQPGLLALAGTPQAQPYYSLVPFMAALESQPQVALPNYGDPVLAGIQQKLLAQQQSNPLLTNKQPINANSILAKTQATQAPMNVGQLLTTAGQQLWQQEVVNPVQDYINTWKRDPTQGLLETIGGVAVVGGLIGLETLTAGAATPFIFGAMAALQAPDLIQSWGSEITNPSDQNLVKAMVSTGSAALAVGSPVKAFKGMTVARNLLEAQVALRKDATTADRAAELLTGFRRTGAGVQGIKTGAALGQQMDTLDVNNVEALTAQLEARNVNLEEGPGAELLKHAQSLEGLRKDIADATAVGDHEGIANALAEIRALGPDLRNAMLSTAYHHIFLPHTPWTHVPLGPIQGVDEAVSVALHEHYQAIYGLTRQMHSGVGLQGPSDMAHTSIASIKEAEGLDRAAGTPHDTANRIELHWQEMRDAVGLKDDSEEEKILQALEEPEKWDGLTPNEQAYGQKLRDLFDAQTAGELKFGYIAHPLQGRVPYSFTGPALLEDEKAQRELETHAELPHQREPRPYGSKSRQWKQAIDESGKVEFQAKTRSQLLKDAQEQKELYESTHEHRQIYSEHSDRIDSLRRSYGQHRGRYNKAVEAAKEAKSVAATTPTSVWLSGSIEDRIASAYKTLGVKPGRWLALADLRKELSDIPRDELDAALKRMGSSSHATLLPEENRKTLRQVDHDAALNTGHEDTHLLGLEQSAFEPKAVAPSTTPLDEAVEAAKAKMAKVLATAKSEMGSTASDLVSMERNQIKKILRAAPPGDELITGAEAVRRALRNHVNRMQSAVFGEALQAHADMAVSKLKDIFNKMPMTHWGAAMELPSFTEKSDLPSVLPETVWQAAGNTEEAAKRMGYFPVHPGVGKAGDLNHRPALYARGELANKIAKATANNTSSQAQSDFLSALYKVSGVSKRFVMYNPVYHALNVAGRAIAFVMNDPSIAGSAFKAVNQLRKDPAAYNSLVEEAGMAGMVHATQWNVSEQVRRLLREEDGQPGFPGAIRSAIGALNNIHKDTMERGLWTAVDQLQLAGYLYSKQRFLEKGISEFEGRRIAAQYANNLGGMVNPLYMSRLWRQLKGMVFFAPSYWSTFLHSLQSVMPGSARLSGALNEIAGGRFAGLAAVPLRAIDNRSRIELVRAQRDWMVTYLAATAVSMDMMNVMFSGHHLWENDPGHEWDVDVTNMPLFGGTQTSPSGEVRRAYITSMPFFRQGVDIGNAIGLGHDWGFAHVFGDQTWQQQDAFHKASMATGALLDGVRRTASTKIGQIPEAAYGLVAGEDLTSRLGQGTQVKVDRPLALASLAPEGYQLQRLWKTYQEATLQYAPGTPQYEQAQQQFQQNLLNFLPSALLNQTGMPSVYHMGVERPAIDDSAYENWITQRDASQARLTADSNAVFSGQMTPLEYTRHKHEEQIRVNQLNSDTWGVSSPGATLNSAYTSLAQQFGLDNQGLSDQDWFERYDQFLPAWEQLLQSASPSTRAAWWEHSTSTWTDADYLEWEARQLRDSLAASIDGQGGNYIRAFQNQLFRLKPTLTVAEYTAAENADPYYSAYKAMLSSMGSTSALGAFVSAFSSPFSKTYIPPLGTTPDEAQTLAQDTGQVVVRPEDAQALAQQAKQVAQSPEVAQAGGIAAASPEFQQQEQSALSAAQEQSQ
jgi:hypothetical protein